MRVLKLYVKVTKNTRMGYLGSRMDNAKLDLLLQKIALSVWDARFFQRFYTILAEDSGLLVEVEDDAQLTQALTNDLTELTDLLEHTRIQQATAARNIVRTRQLASLLIDEEGKINFDRLRKAEELCRAHLFSIGPERQHDAARQEHILKVLQLLLSSKDLQQQLQNMHKPTSHRLVEHIVRDTLQLGTDTVLTDVHIRRAVLSAWFCYLRQNVGSCFATAPAIIVHDEQPIQFLKDIDELLNTGSLQRTFGGVQYTAPISSTWGAGDLRKRFTVSKEVDKQPEIEIWRAPGLLEAFSKVGLIENSLSVNDKVAQSKILFQQIVENWEGTGPLIDTCAEVLIARALMRKWEITHQDVQDFQNRPKPMLQSSLIIHTQKKSVTGISKGDRCERYLVETEMARNAFKALTDNALLRSWEFTIASFAEVKSNFTNFNMYASLGINAQDAGGIGPTLFELFRLKLDQANNRVRELQEEYERHYDFIKAMEVRLQRASSEQEAKWLNAEYRSMRNEFYTIEELRNKASYKARRYASLFNDTRDLYIQLFSEYFQEVYDADLHEVDTGPYDDSPAGFRLLYKHGRANTAVWTRIKNLSEYVDALVSFFTQTESHMANSEDFQGLESDLGEIVTTLVNHVRTPQFLESALHRMAAAHGGRLPKNPLDNLNQVEKKPWAYTSGGAMNKLVSCYFRRDSDPTESARWVENEMELLVFLVDCAKKISPQLSEEYLKDPKRSLLIHSPTHAFLFQPGRKPFAAAASNTAYTYIWVRDHLYLPAFNFVSGLYVDREMIENLVSALALEIPDSLRNTYRETFSFIPGQMRAKDLRDYILDQISKTRDLRINGYPILGPDQVDSFLQRTLPLSRNYQIEARLRELFQNLPGVDTDRLAAWMAIYDKVTGRGPVPPAINAQQFRELALSIIAMHSGSITGSTNWLEEVAWAAQRLGFATPQPIFFADSNWVTDYFSFVINPGTLKLELWRTDITGTKGHPMSHWKQWVDGSRRDLTWGVYLNPVEYRA